MLADRCGGTVFFADFLEMKVISGYPPALEINGDVTSPRRLLAHFLETHIESWIPGWVTVKS